VISSRSAGDAIAHDLRSPLTRLRNRLEAGLRETTDAGRAAALERSIDDLDGVLSTFNAVLRLSRVQAGATGSFRKVRVASITDELAEMYAPVCEEAGLTFEYQSADGLQVVGDSDLIAQALANLLDNAVKYTPRGGAVAFGAKRDGAELEIIVQDSGPGIPPDDRERAVERFVRLEQSRSQPGSGLGLSLAAAVAEAHRGRLVLGDGLSMGERRGLSASLMLPAA
jgi:signal transduction histidine kinase